MKRGFTLLEVMLALAIFALAATAVLQIASGALSNQQILEEKTVAGWVTDAAGSVKPTMQKLIPADSLRLQFYDGTRWQESWSSVQAIPVAVRMTLHSPQWGEIERIWLLRGPQ